MRFRVRSFSTVLLLMLLLGIFLCHSRPSAAGETAVVAAEVVNVRGGPGTGYAVISQAGLNERLAVLSKTGEWYQVRLSDGRNGWVAGWLVNIENSVPQGGGQAVLINGDLVNIRSGPGTGYGVVAQAGRGERFPVLEESAGWYKVRLGTGAAGWVAGWLVSLETSAVPVAPVIPPSSPGAGGAAADGKTAVVTASVLNVRSGPGTSSGIIGQAVQGDSLSILGQSGDWYRVRLSDGKTGWVAGWLVSVRDAERAQGVPPAQQNENQEAPAGPVGNQAGKVLSLQITDSGDKTSTVVKADAPFDYTSFFLSNPERLVVDLKGVAIGTLPPKTTVNSKSVQQVRAGYYQKNPDVTRLVFDLSGGVQYVASLSGDRKTLTVETYIPDISSSFKGKVIAVDAGHGSPDPGAIGPKGTKEKDITLDVAKKAAKLLESRGAKVVMTRPGDKETGLYERAGMANKAGADVFVSIHINANHDPALGGTSTYIYSGSSEPGQAARVQESRRLANYVQSELLKTLGLRDAGVREADFAVLRTTNMPAVLIELAFISNPAEEKLMNTDSFRNKAAEAIVKGIGLYFSEKRTAYSNNRS
ncbi:MAG: SH3 domain-containing protein [Pelotomaculum sp.]|uniref:SH3b domain-containing protein n=1 Tax=Pelotomaculum thermopropionicum (strain DSM 13744 / JCM 10971 / SI) TaxID=370438 RepID=A5D461_PELTS|nr:SH3 domain-containing protein [Pelotomaculum sp.]BAF58967.1 hypothetical protein PTH_0786 [Pelotomaculum thermopropionicum SI]